MLNGLDLFSGYGGISLALSEYVRPITYCEIEPYTQATLISRMDDGTLPFAPIWNDVTTLDGNKFRGMVDIIYGGFPCQDISTAGKGAGLEGKRSGLFFEIVRLTKEIRPSFLFLENVSAIESRGAEKVQEALAEIGYASRWDHLSAAEVGANHKRERWFLLAHSNRTELRLEPGRICGQNRQGSHEPRNDGSQRYVADTDSVRELSKQNSKRITSNRTGDSGKNVANPASQRLEGSDGQESKFSKPAGSSDWWETEPDVGRVVNGPSIRLDRIETVGGILVDKKSGEEAWEKVKVALNGMRLKACGNGVVPFQAKTAFEKLIGIA